MNVQRAQATHPVSPAQVWAGLTAECQARVIQLLARLASNLANLQPVSPPRRPTDAVPSRLPEDPT
jgi:hypothetical protein